MPESCHENCYLYKLNRKKCFFLSVKSPAVFIDFREVQWLFPRSFLPSLVGTLLRLNSHSSPSLCFPSIFLLYNFIVFVQVFVETLDKCFENVCELDLIFHVDRVHFILQEIVMGGMVLETNMQEILLRVNEQDKIEKQEVSLSS